MLELVIVAGSAVLLARPPTRSAGSPRATFAIVSVALVLAMLSTWAVAVANTTNHVEMASGRGMVGRR